MPTIRDVVQALSQRDGLDAVIVLGRDGLTIDSSAKDGIDADGLAALVPPVVAACDRLGSSAARGEFATGLVEYGSGMVLISAISADAILAIIIQPDTNVGSLLYELNRHRSAIAGLL